MRPIFCAVMGLHGTRVSAWEAPSLVLWGEKEGQGNSEGRSLGPPPLPHLLLAALLDGLLLGLLQAHLLHLPLLLLEPPLLRRLVRRLQRSGSSDGRQAAGGACCSPSCSSASDVRRQGEGRREMLGCGPCCSWGLCRRFPPPLPRNRPANGDVWLVEQQPRELHRTSMS